MKQTKRPGQQLKGLSVQELLGVANEESAMDIEIRLIQPFKNHPFRVVDDDKMQDLVESIKTNGVLSPVLLREAEHGHYEMISGHRRMHAAKLAGLDAIPAIIREMSDDEATIIMVDANIQREELLPSEKAFAYKMKMDAMRRTAGRPSKENSGHYVPNLTTDIIGEVEGMSGSLFLLDTTVTAVSAPAESSIRISGKKRFVSSPVFGELVTVVPPVGVSPVGFSVSTSLVRSKVTSMIGVLASW